MFLSSETPLDFFSFQFQRHCDTNFHSEAKEKDVKDCCGYYFLGLTFATISMRIPGGNTQLVVLTLAPAGLSIPHYQCVSRKPSKPPICVPLIKTHSKCNITCSYCWKDVNLLELNQITFLLGCCVALVWWHANQLSWSLYLSKKYRGMHFSRG